MGEKLIPSSGKLLTPDDVWDQWENEWKWSVPDPATRPLYPILYHLAEYIRAKTIVEIGIGRGLGPFVFGLYAKVHDADYCCIDLANHCVNRARVTRDRWDLPITIMQYDSKAVSWYSKKIDLLFIDGGHKEGQTEGDIKNFVRWVRRNGLIFFHCYLNKRHPDVQRAVDEYFDPEKYERMTWPYNSLAVQMWRVK